MVDYLNVEQIETVEFAALLCICGMSGHGILVDYEALGQEHGKVHAAHDLGECPEFGTLFEA